MIALSKPLRPVVVGLALLVAGCSPPGVLNVFDRATGTGFGVERIVEGQIFGDYGQTLDVWRPVAPSVAPRPIIVFYYGGGWVKGARQDYGFAARAYAAKGFIVVVPDYRKVPTVHFPAFVVDAAQAVRWTRDHAAQIGGDPARLALAGHSAGAYAVAMLALDRHWLKEQSVDPGIVKAAVGLCGPYDFYPFTQRRSIDAFAGRGPPELTQPIHFVRADAPPMLLVTGTSDVTVRPRNAINLAAALKAVGAPVVLRNYAGLDHESIVMGLSKPFVRRAPVLADSVAFLNDALARKL